MKASDFLLHILSGLGVVLFAWLARRPARYDAIEEAKVLHYGWIFRGLVCLACLLGVTIGLCGLLIDRAHREGAVVFALFTLGCGAVAAYAIPEVTRVRVLLTDRSITSLSPWRLPLTIAWEDVVRVTYTGFVGWFVITGNGGETIRVPACLRGIISLAEEVRERLSPAVYEKAESGFRFHGLSRGSR